MFTYNTNLYSSVFPEVRLFEENNKKLLKGENIMDKKPQQPQRPNTAPKQQPLKSNPASTKAPAHKKI